MYSIVISYIAVVFHLSQKYDVKVKLNFVENLCILKNTTFSIQKSSSKNAQPKHRCCLAPELKKVFLRHFF